MNSTVPMIGRLPKFSTTSVSKTASICIIFLISSPVSRVHKIHVHTLKDFKQTFHPYYSPRAAAAAAVATHHKTSHHTIVHGTSSSSSSSLAMQFPQRPSTPVPGDARRCSRSHHHHQDCPFVCESVRSSESEIDCYNTSHQADLRRRRRVSLSAAAPTGTRWQNHIRIITNFCL